MPQTIETVVAWRIYILPSELRKLMIPWDVLSTHIQNGNLWTWLDRVGGPGGAEGGKHDVYSGRQRILFLSQRFFDYKKCSPVSSWWGSSHPACKPHKRLILITSFLAEFFSVLTYRTVVLELFGASNDTNGFTISICWTWHHFQLFSSVSKYTAILFI